MTKDGALGNPHGDEGRTGFKSFALNDSRAMWETRVKLVKVCVRCHWKRFYWECETRLKNDNKLVDILLRRRTVLNNVIKHQHSRHGDKLWKLNKINSCSKSRTWDLVYRRAMYPRCIMYGNVFVERLLQWAFQSNFSECSERCERGKFYKCVGIQEPTPGSFFSLSHICTQKRRWKSVCSYHATKGQTL